MIPYGRQSVGQEEIDAVVDVLQSDWLTQGPTVRVFEQQLAEFTEAKHCVAVANGTVALHIACIALGVKPGDHVWTSPISFVASANCARYCGASIDFVDIDPATGNISPQQLEQKFIAAQKNNTLPKVIVVVHFAGNSCDMAAIHALAQQYKCRIIEDAAHAIGGKYREQPVGACTYSDITSFSFHPVKNMTTAEGGALTTNDDKIQQQLRLLASHGITKEMSDWMSGSDEPWFYEQQLLGFNYRLSDVNAAIGVAQLKKLNGFTQQRAVLVERYRHALKNLPLNYMHTTDGAEPCWHIFTISLHQSGMRRYVFDFLRANGIGVNVHYIPIHLQPDFRALGFAPGDFPVSEAYYRGAITLPLYPDLTFAEQDKIIQLLTDVLASDECQALACESTSNETKGEQPL